MKKFLLLFTLLFAFAQVWAQERTVSGKVTSAETGEGLPGVNVLVKGTSTGTVTDIDGNYRLGVPATGGTLVFSFIGLATQEVEVGSRSVIEVQMQSDVQQLSEVVVTAFGVERQRDEVTYATERVSSEDLVVTQPTTAAQALVGKVAGLQVNVQSNGVNPQSQILLRGLRSISANNEALIVIDGTIAGDGAFNDLNPNDIESINVLKGATAAALYGSNAANGVLIVQTKSGKKGDGFRVGLNSSYVLESVAYMPDFQTEHGIGWAGDYNPIENTNWGPRFDGISRIVGPDFPDSYAVADQIIPYAPIKDNVRDFYETGKTMQNTVYLSGADDNSSFYLSLGRRNTTGIVPDDEYERTTIKLNASQQLGKLQLGLNTSFLTDETNVVGNTIGDQDRPLTWFLLNTPANIPLTTYEDWDNPLSYGYADNYYNAFYQNPYWAVGTNRDMDESDRVIANFSASYDITDNINWSTRVGTNLLFGTGKNWRERQEYDADLQPYHSTVSSFVEDFEIQRNDYNGSSLVSGDFDINDDFSIKAIVGAAFVQESFRASQIRGNNLSIPGFYDISNATGQLEGWVNEERKREFGIFADLTVGYNNFLFLNASGRQDYTSTLAAEDNSYFYPAVGVSFVASEAIDAISESNIISYAKLTVSNSTVYSDLDAYDINETYTSSTYFPLGSLSGFALSNETVDAAISKEKLNTTEFATKLGFLNDRFTLDAAYYTTKITDLIVQTTPSRASGATAFLTNIGELSSTGFEVSVGGTVLKAGDFAWRMNVNYTSNETIVEEIKDDLTEIGVDVYTAGYGTFAIVGEAFPQIKASSYVRDPQGRVVVDAVSGNPIIGDVTAHGKATPDYILGATTQLSFKGITLAATMDYRTGHVFYEQGSDAMEFTGRSIASVSANRQDFVWPNSVIEISDGEYVENTNVPITGGVMGFWQNNYNQIKENYVKDATALKLREVSLTYEFPRSLLDRTKVINKLSLGFISRNLLTWLPEENRFSDPEFNNTSGTTAYRPTGGAYGANSIGIGGYLQSPPTRTFGFNLNIEF